MKKIIKKVLILYCLFIASISYAKVGTVSGGINHNMPEWFKDSFLEIEEDIAEANEEDKHLMLFMQLNGCPYCAKMVENFDKNKELIQKDFDVIAINIKGDREVAINELETLTERELANQVGVQYTPTIIFLDKNNNVVGRANGYRDFGDFKHMLNFIKAKHYQKSNFTEYKQQLKQNNIYSLKDNKLFKNIKDLSKIKTPLMVIFEDRSCTLCDDFHNKTLKNTDILTEMKKHIVVRLDAKSNKNIITPNGKTMKIKDFANDLEIFYRPGVVLFDNSEEITRIDGFLYSFHFATILRFVGDRNYQKFASFSEYLNSRTEELINKGIDVNIGK